MERLITHARIDVVMPSNRDSTDNSLAFSVACTCSSCKVIRHVTNAFLYGTIHMPQALNFRKFVGIEWLMIEVRPYSFVGSFAAEEGVD
jgi:hypothetical protein